MSSPARRERIPDPLVAATITLPFAARRPSASAQNIDWIGHVVQRLVHVDQVVAPLQARVGRVALVERHALLEAGPREVRLRRLDRGPVRVDPVHDRVRVRPRDRQRGEALAAGDIGDPSRRVGLQPLVHIGDRGKPFAAEEVLEHRPRELGLRLVQVLAVIRVGRRPRRCGKRRAPRRSAGRRRPRTSRPAR